MASGRPKSQEKLQAQLAGRKYYQGATCSRCGGSQRYTSTSHCTACQGNKSTGEKAPAKARAFRVSKPLALRLAAEIEHLDGQVFREIKKLMGQQSISLTD